ncbi:unnamed protein product [Jaminaea pallidilutea]
MADVKSSGSTELAPAPQGRATYGSFKSNRNLPSFNDDDDDHENNVALPSSSPASPPSRGRDALLDSSPRRQAGRRTNGDDEDDADTGNTTALSSDEEAIVTKRTSGPVYGRGRRDLNLSSSLSHQDDDHGDDEATSRPSGSQSGGSDVLARVRAQMGVEDRGHRSASDRVTSSLSSAPPLRSSQDSDDEEDNLLTRPRAGALAGRMKSKGAVPAPAAKPRKASTRTPSYGFSEEEQSSSASASEDSDGDTARKQRLAATQRRQRLAELAAQKREPEEEEQQQKQRPITLEDDFFAQRDNERDDPIRSSSAHGESDSDDGLYDPRELLKRSQHPGHKESAEASSPSAGVASRNAITGHETMNASSSKSKKTKEHRSKKSKVKRITDVPKPPKQLSKKELEEMHKMSAKIDRSRPVASLALQSAPVQRQQYDIRQLAAKFIPNQKGPQSDDPAESDPIEMDTPHGSKSKVALQGSPSLAKDGTNEASTSRLPPLQAEETAEQVHRRKQQEALRLRKQKWLQAQEGNAQKLPMDTASQSSSDDGFLISAASAPKMDQADDDDDLEIRRPGQGLSSRLFASMSGRLPSTGGAANTKKTEDGNKGASNAQKQQAPHQAQADFKQTLLDKIKAQNIRARAARETASGRHQQQQRANQGSNDQPQRPGDHDADDSSAALKRLQDRARRDDGAASQGDSEGEPDDEDDSDFVPEGAEAQGASQEEASGSESGDGDAEDEVDAQGSGSEIEDLDAMPPSSQMTGHSAVSGDQIRASDDEDEDEEVDDEIYSARPSRRKGQAVFDEEDSDVGADVVLHPPTEAPASPAASSVAGPAGLTQFFTETQVTSAEVPESQLLDPAALAPTTAVHRTGSNDSVLGQFFSDTQFSETPRGQSLDVIGATGPARNAENAAPFLQDSASAGTGGSIGLSQFFNDGTPSQVPDAGVTASVSNFTPGSMAPPPNIPTDGFAALRKQQQGEGILLSPDMSLLPTPPGASDDEGEAIAADPASRRAMGVVRSTPKQYLNPEGFFTQTRPAFDAAAQPSQWTSSQREAESSLAERDSMHDAGESEELGEGSPSTRRKKFRRAVQPSEAGDAQEEVVETVEAADQSGSDSSDEDNGNASGSELGSAAEEEEEAPAHHASHPGASANAWDILRKGAANAEFHKKNQGRRQRDFQFVEGEAEESEDEEGDKRRGGGLDGVFSDSDKSGDEDDDDEDDDGADLENLVDNEKEKDEAAKDILARERFQQDLDVDEAAAMALAEKAARGDLRNKRRGRNGEGRLEDLLDDDFDEERLMRKANNPRAMLAKRRKIEGDEMDVLAAKAESQAFVQGYNETHDSTVGDEYSFLEGAQEDEDQDDDGSSSSESGSGEHSEGEEEQQSEEGDAAQNPGGRGQAIRVRDIFDEDADEVPEPQRQRVTRKELARELRERAKRRKRGVVADDDEENDDVLAAIAQVLPPRDPFASDDSDGEMEVSTSRLPAFLRDRLSKPQQQKSGASGLPDTAQRRGDRKDEVEDDDDDETQIDSADPASAILAGLKRKRQAASPQTAQRMAKLAAEYKSEPDFSAGRNAQVRSGLGGAGSSITSFGARTAGKVDRQKAGAGAFVKTKAVGASDVGVGVPGAGGAKGPSRVGSAGILAARRVEESQ